MILDKNAYIIPLNAPLPPALVQKDNGSALYFTRDIACVLNRYQQFTFNKCLFVVGNEQKLHFQQLQKVIEKMGYDYALKHINFGLITIQNVKISSRKNNQYQLKNIIQKTVNEAKKVIQRKNPNLENINQITTQIAIGAIIFNDLKNDRHLNIDFNLKQMLQFEGNTGPYLQYTVVRLYSLMQKNNSIEIDLPKDWKPFIFYYQQPHYFNLIKLMGYFPVILKKSQEHHMPSILARYIFQLAKNTNQFYTKEKILSTDPILKKANLLFIETIRIVLEEGLKILGIPILKKM
ncbi:Arginyl-tRNA synthetase [Candidatus Phytoplasma phoenicium]|uniref:arginine--tRNA ligase n=2 Tax=Candidatus Phytoplasma phoenicium TaxID=198422 RepID=A0A0L0MK93_9MOLU|nr:Arginyl-tRNA synthetase [Candidatus Phytoplasma phoenicium]